jgi:TolB-like protein
MGDRIHFANFEVDLASSDLYQGGRRIKIQEQPFRILTMLLDAPGRLVTREAIKKTLWPQNTFVDFEAGLNTAIRKLRAALGDNADTPQFIETLPRRGYRFILPLTSSNNRTIDSVAVLPLTFEGPRQHDYVSDGITEALIHRLSEIPELQRVTARGSVYRYKGKYDDLRDIGRVLDVAAVVTGSVTLRNRTLRVNAELASTSDLRHLWCGTYERPLPEVSALQDELARDIISALRLKTARHQRSTRISGTGDLEVYQLYLQGRYWWNKRPLEGAVQRAIEFFEKAIQKDPSFPLPYVGLADSYNTLAAWESGVMAPNVAFPLARSAAMQALQANPDVGEAHTSLAYAELHFGWKWRQSEEHFQRALALNPNYAYCRHWYSHFLTAMGRTEESLAESIRIIELDPLDLIINVHLSWHYYMACQYQEAFDQANRTLAMEPSFHWGYFFRGLALEQFDRSQEAVDALRRSVDLAAGSPVMLSALGHAYAVAGDSVNARKVLASLQEELNRRYVSSYEIALIHAGLGGDDEAFSWLNKACGERSGWLPYVCVEPRLQHLRSDIRFHALVERIGLRQRTPR